MHRNEVFIVGRVAKTLTDEKWANAARQAAPHIWVETFTSPLGTVLHQVLVPKDHADALKELQRHDEVGITGTLQHTLLPAAMRTAGATGIVVRIVLDEIEVRRPVRRADRINSMLAPIYYRRQQAAEQIAFLEQQLKTASLQNRQLNTQVHDLGAQVTELREKNTKELFDLMTGGS